jgi:hypothetical protein
VRCRVTAVDPGGRLTPWGRRAASSPWVPADATIRVGDWLDVQTSVHPTS